MYRGLMLGLPETGKTTFLAALWHVVEAADVHGALRCSALHENHKHLNRIRDAWVECRPMERTLVAAEQVVTMRLVSPDGTGEIELVVPDMSGESFRSYLEDRQWPTTFDEFVIGATGVLLFVHPAHVRDPMRIDHADDLYSVLANGNAAPSEGVEPAGVLWKRDFVPTQVQLVDLLQIVLERAADTLPVKLAVNISAWDTVRDVDQSPDLWLEQRLPLLNQYLRANPEQMDVRVYGLSAQGGDLVRDIDRLAALDVPSERIVVCVGGIDTHDVTAPIRWLMSGMPGE